MKFQGQHDSDDGRLHDPISCLDGMSGNLAGETVVVSACEGGFVLNPWAHRVNLNAPLNSSDADSRNAGAETVLANVQSSDDPDSQASSRPSTPIFENFYVLGELVGGGAQGEVFEAHPTHQGPTVVAKIPIGRQRQEEFERAHKLGARFQTGQFPNFGLLWERSDGSPCYTMRYIQGGRVDTLVSAIHAAVGIKPILTAQHSQDTGELTDEHRRDIYSAFLIAPDSKDGSFSPHTQQLLLLKLVEIVRDVAGAAGSMHRRGVVHRDIKPSNLVYEYESGIVHVIDLDTAVESADADRLAEITGTPAFMSPEQANGSGAGAYSDIYALGAVLYQMVTGKNFNPVPDINAPSAIKNWIKALDAQDIIYHDPQGISRFRHLDLRSIIVKATRHAREDRYENADQMRQDLDAWLAGAPVNAFLKEVGVSWHRVQRFILGDASGYRNLPQDFAGRQIGFVSDVRKVLSGTVYKVYHWYRDNTAKAGALAGVALTSLATLVGYSWYQSRQQSEADSLARSVAQLNHNRDIFKSPRFRQLDQISKLPIEQIENLRSAGLKEFLDQREREIRDRIELLKPFSKWEHPARQIERAERLIDELQGIERIFQERLGAREKNVQILGKFTDKYQAVYGLLNHDFAAQYAKVPQGQINDALQVVAPAFAGREDFPDCTADIHMWSSALSDQQSCEIIERITGISPKELSPDELTWIRDCIANLLESKSFNIPQTATGYQADQQGNVIKAGEYLGSVRTLKRYDSRELKDVPFGHFCQWLRVEQATEGERAAILQEHIDRVVAEYSKGVDDGRASPLAASDLVALGRYLQRQVKRELAFFAYQEAIAKAEKAAESRAALLPARVGCAEVMIDLGYGYLGKLASEPNNDELRDQAYEAFKEALGYLNLSRGFVEGSGGDERGTQLVMAHLLSCIGRATAGLYGLSDRSGDSEDSKAAYSKAIATCNQFNFSKATIYRQQALDCLNTRDYENARVYFHLACKEAREIRMEIAPYLAACYGSLGEAKDLHRLITWRIQSVFYNQAVPLDENEPVGVDVEGLIERADQKIKENPALVAPYHWIYLALSYGRLPDLRDLPRNDVEMIVRWLFSTAIKSLEQTRSPSAKMVQLNTTDKQILADLTDKGFADDCFNRLEHLTAKKQ